MYSGTVIIVISSNRCGLPQFSLKTSGNNFSQLQFETTIITTLNTSVVKTDVLLRGIFSCPYHFCFSFGQKKKGEGINEVLSQILLPLTSDLEFLCRLFTSTCFIYLYFMSRFPFGPFPDCFLTAAGEVVRTCCILFRVLCASRESGCDHTVSSPEEEKKSENSIFLKAQHSLKSIS